MKQDTAAVLTPTRDTVLNVDPRTIVVDEGFNVRQDYGDIDELTKQIKENGIKNPLHGYKQTDGSIHLIDGHRRLKAALSLVNKTSGGMRIPIILEKKPSEVERIVDMYICNEGEPLNPLEESEIINRLVLHGLTSKEIARKLGCTEAHVSNMNKLSSLPVRLKNHIKNNDVSASLVLQLTRKDKELTEDQMATKISDIVTKYKSFSGAAGKVTQRVINEELNRHNSYVFIKRIISSTPESKIGNKPLFKIFKQIVNGELSFEKVKKLLDVNEE